MAAAMSLVNSVLCRNAPRVLNVAIPAVSRLHQARLASTQPNYEGHIPLNWLEHGLMFVGASYQALMHPQRGGTYCLDL